MRPERENRHGKDSKSPVIVSVLLDGEESLLEFHVHRSSTTETTNATSLNTASTSELEDDVKAMTSQDSPEDPHLTLHHCDAYTVIFALTEHASFQYGCRCLRLLREEWGTDRAITLVGNKADLVRQRRVSCKEACTLAHKYDCKYIETSAELGHQTDELLVGTLRQIRLKLSMTSQDDHFHDVKTTAKKPPSHKWQRLSCIYRFLHGDSRAGDSCQDFFV
ncbi:hypothetical protein V1264_000488 [Littorina saxatilis]|uniref:Uncharacterized protein n=1 Tax=Littorina saxatilis TaxID=31220 RepID=A0AAN9BZ02_9CAEN